MAQKNDTTALILTFLITAGLVGAGFWWFTQKSSVNLGRLTSPNSTSADPQSNPSTGNGFSTIQNVPTGLFNYGGSTSWAPIRQRVDSALQSAKPEFRLRYVDPISGTPGSAAGIRMLLRDELAFAQSARPILDQEYQQAEQRGIKLKQVPVAIDGIAIAVNPSLAVPGLTLDQLAAIYSSRITNWSEVGGPNLAIQPFTRPVEAGGTIELFVEQILKRRRFGATVQTVSTTTDAIRRLANSPGGIYFASAPEVVPQCTIKSIPIGRRSNEFVAPYQDPLITPDQCPAQRNQLNISAFQNGQYHLTRNLYVVVKQNGGIEEQAGSAYANLLLTVQGQELIGEAGFVKIR